MQRRRKPSGRIGRQPSTTPDLISGVGIELFATYGFEETSVEQIAEAAGIARRTFFRYFPSKNAVPWGDFGAHLHEMRTLLSELPPDVAIGEGLKSALLAFNRFPPEDTATQRKRMALILEVPSLQAYSMLMYTGWRGVIAEYVAARLHMKASDHVPTTVGWMLLGVAIAGYEQWLTDDSLDLQVLLAAGADVLNQGLNGLTARHELS